jgi:hypothetical protein
MGTEIYEDSAFYYYSQRMNTWSSNISKSTTFVVSESKSTEVVKPDFLFSEV